MSEDSPLFKGWSTKDILMVGVFVSGLIAFGSSLDKRVDAALSSAVELTKTLRSFEVEHRLIMDKIGEINAFVVKVETRQTVDSHRLDATEMRSIECLRGGDECLRQGGRNK